MFLLLHNEEVLSVLDFPAVGLLPPSPDLFTIGPLCSLDMALVLLDEKRFPINNISQALSQTIALPWSTGCGTASPGTREATEERWNGQVPAT